MKRDIEFLFEMGMLRNIKRAWVQALTPEFENLSEHMFRVIWLALLISKMEKTGDHEKIMKMALIHDIPESRTGDVHYVGRLYTKRDEDTAMNDMIGDTVFADFLPLWHEYEKRESIESKIVKDADTLAVDMELTEQWYRGNKAKEIWQTQREKIARHGLFTETAKKLWQEIQSANPHDWHLNGKNRLNSGDWKEFK